MNAGKSIENNTLELSSLSSGGLDNGLLTGEFSEALGEFLSADGKLKPLDLATLKQLGIEQLSDLQDLAKLNLPADSLDLEQLTALSNLITSQHDSEVESIDIFGNPDVQSLLNINLINDEQIEEGLLNNKATSKTDLFLTKVIASDTDVLQQSLLKKEFDMSRAFDEMSFSKILKNGANSDIDFASEFLTQNGRQESNITRLVDQLTSIDKPVNSLSPINNSSLKSYSGIEHSGTTLNRIEVPVNQAGWGEAVGNRLMMMANGKIHSANIHLNPAELGPIEIRVSVNNEHASVHFVSNNSLVRDAIEDAMPRLKEMLSQNGLNLSDANVSQQSPQQSSQHSSQFFDEQNDSIATINNESIETTDIQTQNTNNNLIDIGLIDQYV